MSANVPPFRYGLRTPPALSAVIPNYHVPLAVSPLLAPPPTLPSQLQALSRGDLPCRHYSLCAIFGPLFRVAGGLYCFAGG
ncbi:hypothetical protein FIBSPDRAFT_853416 [Athelia psychrophila]|uniref:Uncharacterized protein n=1 Tax=Athelia psychrophila TaxID=1759441 RepID=A0A166QUM7_9AGAM|nr:hypothetical protein FIBSPDRAFT_853416 [Fibularhizoctonia sp. CBS 109695]